MATQSRDRFHLGTRRKGGVNHMSHGAAASRDGSTSRRDKLQNRVVVCSAETQRRRLTRRRCHGVIDDTPQQTRFFTDTTALHKLRHQHLPLLVCRLSASAMHYVTALKGPYTRWRRTARTTHDPPVLSGCQCTTVARTLAHRMLCRLAHSTGDDNWQPEDQCQGQETAGLEITAC